MFIVSTPRRSKAEICGIPLPLQRSVTSEFSSKTSPKYKQSTSCVEGIIKLRQSNVEKLILCLLDRASL